MGVYFKIANMTRREYVNDVIHSKDGQYNDARNPPVRTLRALVASGRWKPEDDVVVVNDAGGSYTSVDVHGSMTGPKLVEEVGLERGYSTPDYEYVCDTFVGIEPEPDRVDTCTTS